jgi:ribose transport system substrate-binding protein
MNRHLGRRLIFLSLLLTVMGMTVMGCGSSSSSSSSTEAETTPAETEETAPAESEGEEPEEAEAAAGSGVEEAAEMVASLSDPESLEYPEPPEGAYSPGNKKAAIIACALAGAGCKLGAEYAEEAFKAAGWSTTPIGDGQFSPTTQASLIQKAVQEKVSAIFLSAVEVSATKSAVDAAAEAGIPIVCWQCYSPPEMVESGKVMDVVDGGKQAGEAMTAYAVAKSEGKGPLMVVTLPEFAIGREFAVGAEAAAKKYCPECEVEVINMKATEIAEAGPPVWTAALSSHPKGSFEWVMIQSDSIGIPITKTAIQTGRTEIHTTSGEVEPEMLKLIKEGEVATADSFTLGGYAAWAGVDNVMRKAGGEEPWNMENMPVGVIDTSNVDTFLAAAPEPYEPPSFPYKKMFKELWSGK